jgi:uncharacterized phiE125 gp8 family phage protein
MSYRRTTDAAAEPLTLAEAKAWLRVTDTAEDTLITALIVGARQMAEQRCNRAFITQTWELVLDEFPDGTTIELPVAPLIAITSVAYTDTDGNGQTLVENTDFAKDVVREPGRIELMPSKSWPSTEDGINKVTITWTAGYGTASTNMPEDLITAVRYMLSEWFSDRREISHGNPRIIPFRANSILWKYRLFPE